MKRCSKCGEEKPNTFEFFTVHHTRVDGTKATSGSCKVCQRSYSKSWREENPDRYKAQMAKFKALNPGYERDRARRRYKEDPRVKERINLYNKNNPDKRRLQGLRTKYKVDSLVIMEKMDNQVGCCAICGKSLVFPDSKKSYHIDHNHNTGDIRGLLCARCNAFVGAIETDSSMLSKTLLYLNKYKEIND